MKKFFQLLFKAIKGEEQEFTSGPIRRSIFLLAVPMILEMVMESLFALVDVFFVSTVGTEAVATVGLTEVVLMTIESLALGIAMAATAMVSRRIGEKNKKGAREAAVQTIFLGLIISIPIGIAMWFGAEKILELMGGSPHLIAEGKMYTKLILGLNGLLFFLFILNAIFRGAGDAAIAMRVLWLANGLNIILDPCFILGLGPFPELGVTGAAVATCIGRGTGVIFQLYFLFFSKKSVIRLQMSDFRWVSNTISKLFSVSLTGAWQYLIAVASWVFLVRIISSFGDQSLAGYTIAIRILIFTILPAWGMANAAATLVGQNLGAGKPERAEKAVWLTGFYNMVFLATVSVIFFISAPWIIQFFSEDPIVCREGVRGLRIMCLGYIAYGYGMVISSSFNGAGDTKTPMYINLISFWLIQIPLAYVLAHSFGLEAGGTYWAIAISETILAVIAIYIFRLGKWKKVTI
jgi:putative MATE family efflux protein